MGKKKEEQIKSLFFSGDLFEIGGVEEDTEVKAGDIIISAIFREGNWDHPWYGDVDITRDYLETIVQNHARKVVSNRLSVNKHHDFSHGAYGWIEEKEGAVFAQPMMVDLGTGPIELMYLFARWEVTDLGAEAINKKIFRYFSAEIEPDFCTFEKVPNSDGSKTILKHGPTLTAFALTNDPFIPNLPGLFSNSPESNGGTEKVILEDEAPGQFYSYRKSDNVEPPNFSKKKEDPVVDTSEKTNKEKMMKFNKIVTDLNSKATVAEKLEFAANIQTQIDSGTIELEDSEKMAFSMLKDVLNESKREAEAIELALDKSVQKLELAKRETERLTNERADMLIKLKTANEGSYQTRVELFCKDLEAKGQFPAVIEEVKEVLSDFSGSMREQKFTSVSDENVSADIFDILTRVFSKIPKDGLLDTSVHTEGNDTQVVPDGEGNDGAGSGDDVPANVLAFCKKYNYEPSEVEDWSAIGENGELKFS